MSADDIHTYAQKTTPQDVHVPNTIAGLVVWAVGKVGTAAIWASVAYVGLWIVYNDLRSLNQQVLKAFVSQTQTQALMADAITKMAEATHVPRPTIQTPQEDK